MYILLCFLLLLPAGIVLALAYFNTHLETGKAAFIIAHGHELC